LGSLLAGACVAGVLLSRGRVSPGGAFTDGSKQGEKSAGKCAPGAGSCGSCSGACLRKQLTKAAQPWLQPHRVKVRHGDAELEALLQGQDQWQLVLSEAGSGPDGPSLAASTLKGSPLAYSMHYDSEKSRFKPPAALGFKRAAFSAASQEGHLDNLDWVLQVHGDGPTQLAVAGDGASVSYDGTFGVSMPVAKDVSAMYAVDVKRRSKDGSLVPSWVRQGAAVRYASKAGDVKLVLSQPNPDKKAQAGLDVEAVFSGSAPKQPGAPQYTLRAAKELDASPTYDAKVKLTGPPGVTGGLDFAVKGGKPSISGYTELAAKRQVLQGLDLGADVKVVATPTSKAAENRLELMPVNLKASADLARLLPQVAGKGSTLDVRARYKLGGDLPSLGVSAKLDAKPLLPVQLAADGDIDPNGQVTGTLRVGGASHGVSAAYIAVAQAGDGASTRHLAEVSMPVAVKGADATVFGRISQSAKDHDGKPRLQLGVQYGAGLSGGKVQVSGESALVDSGSLLLAGDGTPWSDSRLKKARGSAGVVRRRAEATESQGHAWLRK
jgi:hypothetical protein